MNLKCDYICFILFLYFIVKGKNIGVKNVLFDVYGYNINVLLFIYRFLIY